MRILLHLLVHVLVWVIGAGLIAVAVAPQLLIQSTQWLVEYGTQEGGRLIIGGIGGVMIALPITQLLRWWSRHRIARELSYQTTDGQITVSLVAIEEALERSLIQVTGLKKSSIDVNEDRVRRQVIVEAVLSLWEDADIGVINREAQVLLRRRFAELMPEMPNCIVKVTVSRLNPRRKADKRSEDQAQQAAKTGKKLNAQGQRITEPTNDGDQSVAPLPGLSLTQGQSTV